MSTEINRRRAFAIIAHPDAGKTTLTEKLLLYGGAIQLAGHVRARKNRKSTRSDWMRMEKERGISVSSAALQFEYKGCILNLLDTPGHEDFSEDTYRTLIAADTAVMVLDASKGVEAQTIKLFRVCREREIPIITFINKMDMPALSPFDLLDQTEKTLGITAVPLLWPMGSGADFKGLYDLSSGVVHRYERTTGGAFRAPEKTGGLDDPELANIMDAEALEVFREGAQLASEALPPFDQKSFLKGEITPVFFGSAVNNFGIQLFLDRFLEIAPPPSPVELQDGSLLSPEDKRFSGFIFKLQANMNQRHRDRVAFLRIISGIFERGMNAYLPRLGKQIKLSSPVSFFGQDRSVIDKAYPGDIIGLINPGQFRIGDILCTGETPALKPLPVYAPEIFARIILTDSGKMKGYRKGLDQLREEGVVQVFRTNDGSYVLGAAGQLQFESFQFRLQDEYGAPVRLETMAYECSRWTDEATIKKLSSYDLILRDENDNPVALFKSEFRLKKLLASEEDLFLLPHPPHDRSQAVTG